MSKIEITPEQARQHMETSAVGISEARAKISREIEAASRGLLSKHRIPIPKRQISANEVTQLLEELESLGFGNELAESNDFYTFIVSWDEA